MRPDITVVIPTVTGREEHLARCIASYEASAATTEILVFRNLPGVAYGWQRGAETAKGQYIHLTCDDIEARPGWDEAAMEYADKGWQPAPRLFNTDGRPWNGAPPEYDPRNVAHGERVPLGSLPFMRWDMWPQVTPLPPGMHYFADNWVTWRLDLAGVETRMCHGYDFTHSWASEHRGAGYPPNERGPADAEYIALATSIVERGLAGLA